MTNRQLLVLSTALAITLLGGGVASAEVSVTPVGATPGSTTVLDFAVSDLRTDAPTTKVEIKLPVGSTFTTVAARPKIGWDTTLVRPSGATAGPASSVVWTLTDNRFGIAPGAFDVFSLQLGPVPATGALAFPTVQTYANQTVDVWTNAVVTIPVAPTAVAPAPDKAKPDNRGRVTAGLATGGALILLAVLGSALFGRRSRAEEELLVQGAPSELPRVEV